MTVRRLALGALVAVAALVLAPALLGYQRYVITGGSMGGSLPRGSIAYERTVPVTRLRVGDVITYTPPSAAAVAAARVTHRIVWVGRARGGARAFRTKGDANARPDPWRFVLRRPEQARVVFHVPLAGYALAALSLRWVRMLAIGLPALAIAAIAARGSRPRREAPA